MTNWLKRAKVGCPDCRGYPRWDHCQRDIEHQRTATLLEEVAEEYERKGWEAFADASSWRLFTDEELAALRERGPTDAD